jgi:hypothetical protein
MINRGKYMTKVAGLIVHIDEDTGNLINIEQPHMMNLFVFEHVVKLLTDKLIKAKKGVTLNPTPPPEVIQKLMDTTEKKPTQEEN